MQQFSIKPRIYFNRDSIDYLKEIEGNRALIVTDGVMEQLGFSDSVIKILGEKGIRSQVFSDIQPDPNIKMIVDGMRKMSEDFPDIVIALGGGSVIDTTKGILYAFWKMRSSKGEEFKKPTFIAIPSTSGTGSEVTSFSVIKIGEEKLALVDEWMIPDIAILDPIFVESVPSKITADTGMDVLCHALEAYVSTDASDFTDALAEKTVKIVFDYLLDAYRDGSNKEAREKMHNASCMAGMAFTNASLGINHSLAHALGGIFHIPHGRANALLLPYVVAYNADLEGGAKNLVADKYAYLAELLHLPSSTSAEGTRNLIAAIRVLKEKMNMPNGICDVNIEGEAFERQIDNLTTLALNDSCTVTNPRQPSREDIKRIYRDTFQGK
jgi:alcohol dehydrogenase class IV